MATTTTATRPACLPEEVAEQLHPSTLYGLHEAVEAQDDEEQATCLVDLAEDLQALAEEHPEDWSLICGTKTPAQVALAYWLHLTDKATA